MEYVHEKFSQGLLAQVAGKIVCWKKLAPHLGMSQSDIVAIERDGVDEDDKRRKLLQRWLQRNGRKATNYKLIEAFVGADDKDAADEVCKCMAGISSCAIVTVLHII